MSPAPRKRSTFLVIVGVGVFVVGTALAAFATRDSGGSSSAASVTPTSAPAGTVSAPTGVPAFVIPPGHQAIALTVPFVQGVAGYAKAGSHVNVYGAFKNNAANASLDRTASKLVMANIAVLSVSPADPNGNLTYVLSVDANQAEQVVYLQSFESSYLTLARDDQGQLTTVGRNPKNAA